MASISTPVGPVVRHRQFSLSPGRCSSGWMSTSIPLKEIGWHKGISSQVRLAAWIAAIRATANTSPFGVSPRRMKPRVATSIWIVPWACASRKVGGRSPTSTMRTSPLLLRWLRLRSLSIRSRSRHLFVDRSSSPLASSCLWLPLHEAKGCCLSRLWLFPAHCCARLLSGQGYLRFESGLG